MEKLKKYQRGKIYKVVDTSYTECYIGSSTQRFLCNRMASHRANYKLWKHNQYANCAVFSLFDKYGVDNCKIELIESYPCESLEELRRREGHWIKLEECINKRVAGRTDLEYYYDNIEKFKEYQELNTETNPREKNNTIKNTSKISSSIGGSIKSHIRIDSRRRNEFIMKPTKIK